MRLGITIVLTATACGPSVVLEHDSEGVGTTSRGETSSTGSNDPSATTTSGSADDTTSEPGSTTADDSTGGPNEPCPAPIPGLTFLWCGDASDRSDPVSDGAWVYFTAGDGDLWRVPAVGGEAEALAEGLGDVFELEVVDERVYWAAFFDGVVGSVAVTGGPPQILADDLFKPSSIAVSGGYAFVTQYAANLPLMRYELATGQATPLHPDLDYAGHAFVLEGALYFATDTNDGNNPTPLWRGAFDDAPLVMVLDAGGIIEDIDPEGQTLWWARYRYQDSALRHTELVEPAITTTTYALSPHPLALALTPERIYWTDVEVGIDGGTQQSRLASVTRDGDDLVVHYASFDSLGGLVATDAGVVLVVPGALARLD